MRKTILTFILIVVAIIGVNAQDQATQDSTIVDTVKLIEALKQHDLFLQKQEAWTKVLEQIKPDQEKWEKAVANYNLYQEILLNEFIKTIGYYWYIAMEKSNNNNIDNTKDTIVVREVYVEKPKELRKLQPNQSHLDTWTNIMKLQYLKKK